VLSYLCLGEAIAFPGAENLETHENVDQGIIILFSQNYSENNDIPKNVFVAKVQGNNICDRLYPVIYGALRPQITINNTSKVLEYKTTRVSCLCPCCLLPIADSVLDFGVKKVPGGLMKSPETEGFCEAALISLVQYREQPRQSGSLYISNLPPMVKCTYQVSMDLETDDDRGFVELNSPGSRFIIQGMNKSTTLTSYFKDPSGDIRSKTICIGEATGKSDFEIAFDGYNKTNTIFTADGNSIVTPFYSFEKQNLPYVDFSNGYIKFTAFIMGEGTYFDVNLYNINQKADRKLITPIGSNKIMPFGIDGPHGRNTTEQGIKYLNAKNNKSSSHDTGTIWFDIDILEQCNETDLEYLRSLVANDSWDVGVHYSEELNSLSLEQAYEVIYEGYFYVYEKIGRKPTSWCSLRNRDNITHAVYAYEKFGMLWRNGDSGINAEKGVGSLEDSTWGWWESASKAGIITPVFTHELDREPAIKYSISPSKFRAWVDNYYSTDTPIVSFYEYNQVNRNTYDAYFDNLDYNESRIRFDAHTNGYRALVNVNMSAGEDIQAYDETLDKVLDYTLEKDNSINIWVENNHTYSIHLD
jgi:hypothetical protein